MNDTWPGRAASWAGFSGLPADSPLDSELGDPIGTLAPRGARWVGWRMRLLATCALLGCLGLFGLIRIAIALPHLDAVWRVDAQDRITVESSRDPVLRDEQGQALESVTGNGITVALPDAEALQRSPRWIIEDAERERLAALDRRLGAVFSHDRVELRFADGVTVVARPGALGLAGLPVQFWLLAAFALALYLVGMVVTLAQPSGRNLVYTVMALCQAGNLLCIAVEAALPFALLPRFAQWNLPLRVMFDLCTAAAMVHAACLHPRRLPGVGWIALLAWGTAAALSAAAAIGALPDLWWWVQGAVAGYGLVAIGLLSWSHRIEPHPVAIVLRRFAIVAVGTWVLLTIALAAADRLHDLARNVADVGSMAWYVFLGSLLLLAPFLGRSQHFMREFSLLAAVSTIATSLDLLFVAVFSLGQFASLTLSLFLSLAVYSGVRQWVLNHLLGNNMLTTERTFEQLYRIAREVEAHPETAAPLLSQLLTDLFEPLEVEQVERRTVRTRVAGDGSSLLVPWPQFDGEPAAGGALLIRYAQRGRRLFTVEDARLTDRIVEQLRRAVRFDKAVEQGRSEERLRLAQDLHDDIGARLLTLMYKVESPEMEDYLRHTLLDLKTLTRGLAASNHPLSHAAAEWKSDLTQRLTAARVDLKWHFAFDKDVLLTVVHWSALTRILRELVSNVIAHAQARTLDVDFRLEADRLEWVITDDGVGRDPRSWSHGLGLGGVRKRVKQLGGEVEWREATPRGITCRVVIRDLTARGS